MKIVRIYLLLLLVVICFILFSFDGGRRRALLRAAATSEAAPEFEPTPDIKVSATDPEADYTSISALNAATLSPGDTVGFLRGETFYGELTLGESGTSGNPITFRPYGDKSDPEPIIFGMDVVTGWVDHGNIESAPTSASTGLNIVVIDGVSVPRGRWPDAGTWANYESYSTNVSITDNELSSTPDWDGAEVVIKKAIYDIERRTITDHTGTTITYSGGGSTPKNDWGYFVQDDYETLTSYGEWYFDGDSLHVYWGAEDPDNHVVWAPDVTQLVTGESGYDYMVFENLHFYGANTHVVDLYGATDVEFDNCTFMYAGDIGLRSDTGPNIIVDSCTFKYNQSQALHIRGTSPNALVTYNTIVKNGWLVGMAQQGWDDYQSVWFASDGGEMAYNSVDTAGYMAIDFGGTDTEIHHNRVNYYGFIMEDGGGIYYGGEETDTLFHVHHNLVMNGVIADPSSKASGYPTTWNAGIYMDDKTQNASIHDNVIYNTSRGGIYIHNSVRIDISHNLIYNCARQIDLISDVLFPTWDLRNITVDTNVFVAKTATQIIDLVVAYDSQNDLIGDLDYNYYCRPLDDSGDIILEAVGAGWDETYYTLAEWRTEYGYDTNTSQSPVTLTDSDSILFYYNWTPAAIDIDITVDVVTVDDTPYTAPTTYELGAYEGVVLFIDPGP